MSKIISERIKEGLRLRGMKQADIVKITGIGKSSISTYIANTFEPKRKNIAKIAKALNVSEDWLMGLDVSMERLQYGNSLDVTDIDFELFRNYKKLNDLGKSKLLDYCNDLIEIYKYIEGAN